MTAKLTPPLTAPRLMLLLEEAHREGRVEHDVFTELAEDYEFACGERSQLHSARANAASWEATVLEQLAAVKAGTCPPERLKSSAYCLEMAQSELGRLETEAGRVRRALWSALVRASLPTSDSATDTAAPAH